MDMAFKAFGFGEKSEPEEGATEQSFMERMGNALCGVVFGVLLFMAGLAICWWNEGRYVFDQCVVEIMATEKQDISCVYDPTNDGKLIYTSCEIPTTEVNTFTQPELNYEGTGIKYELRVEQYQQFASEKKGKTKKKKVGGGTTTAASTWTLGHKWGSSKAQDIPDAAKKYFDNNNIRYERVPATFPEGLDDKNKDVTELNVGSTTGKTFKLKGKYVGQATKPAVNVGNDMECKFVASAFTSVQRRCDAGGKCKTKVGGLECKNDFCVPDGSAAPANTTKAATTAPGGVTTTKTATTATTKAATTAPGGGSRSACPSSHPYALEWNGSGIYWCYETSDKDSEVCRYTGTLPAPAGGTWGTNQTPCPQATSTTAASTTAASTTAASTTAASTTAASTNAASTTSTVAAGCVDDPGDYLKEAATTMPALTDCTAAIQVAAGMGIECDSDITILSTKIPDGTKLSEVCPLSCGICVADTSTAVAGSSTAAAGTSTAVAGSSTAAGGSSTAAGNSSSTTEGNISSTTEAGSSSTTAAKEKQQGNDAAIGVLSSVAVLLTFVV